MRTLPRRLAALLLAVPLVLAGCSGSGSSDGGSGGGSSAALPAVTGKPDEAPTVKAGKGKPPKRLVTRTLEQGDGPKVGKGDLMVAQYVGETWKGKSFGSTWKQGQPIGLPIGVGKVFPGFDKGLVGVKAGSRVELSVPPKDAFGKKGNPQAGIKGTDTLVFVVDVLGSHGAKEGAHGSPAQSPAPVPVNVSGKAPAQPKVTVDKGATAPSSLVSRTLVQGNGPEVKKGDLLVAQYTGLTLRNGKTFDSSWQRGQPVAFPIGTGQVISGWDKGLVGAKAGSRVLLSIPPADAYGKKGNPQAGIKGTDTLVFVVDVLGSY